MEHKEMRWPKLALICSLALLVFFVAQGRVNARITELKTEETELTVQLSKLQAKQDNLQAEMSQVGTESYIENRARTDYQYLKPGELRFEIINPEALYGVSDAELQQAAAGEGDTQADQR